MRKTIYLLFIILALNGCKIAKKNINIITDQITLYEFANYFNSKNRDLKVTVDYFDNKNISITGEGSNIFKYVKDNKLNNYDLIIGEKKDAIINKNEFSKITKHSKILKNKKEKDKLYPVILNYLDNNNELETLYSIDFPVIVARKDSLSENLINENIMDIDTFCETAKSVNQYKQNTQYNDNRIGFSPLISELSEIDYYFIFNSQLEKTKNNYSFNTADTQRAYNFYQGFDDKFNFGTDTTKKYIKLFSNINKNFYLKEKIISFDFINISNAPNYSDDSYKIFLIKNLKKISLKNIIIAIPKTSINKREAGSFIDFLYEYEPQKKLQDEIIKKDDFYSTLHIPPIKNVIKDVKGIDIPFDILNNYIENLESPNFYNKNIYKLFFEKYYSTKEMVNNGLISEKDFLEYFSKELNK